jgi:hypothetical protein
MLFRVFPRQKAKIQANKWQKLLKQHYFEKKFDPLYEYENFYPEMKTAYHMSHKNLLGRIWSFLKVIFFSYLLQLQNFISTAKLQGRA